MASVTSQVIEKVTAHAQRDILEDLREICTDGTYFPNNLRTMDLTVTSTLPQLHILKLNITLHSPSNPCTVIY